MERFTKKLENVEASLDKDKSVDDTREALLSLISYLKSDDFRQDVAEMVLEFPLYKMRDLFASSEKEFKDCLNAQSRRTETDD